MVIGELDGPVGYFIANLMGNQTIGHAHVYALLDCDVQVRPVTVMVSMEALRCKSFQSK